MDLDLVGLLLAFTSVHGEAFGNASPADLASSLLLLCCPFQNFKSAVRRLEHTTLLLTALALPQQPDLLMLWATEGYSPFVEPSEGQGVRVSPFLSFPSLSSPPTSERFVHRDDGNGANWHWLLL